MRKTNRMKVLGAVFLSAILALATGCGSRKGGAGNGGKNPESQNPYTPEVRGDVSGIHIYNVTETNVDFIKDGKTAYTIVLPKDADYYEQTAAQELDIFMTQATGAHFSVIGDDALTPQQIADKEGKYVSIGNTKILAAENIVPDKKELGDGGFIIKTIGNRLILTGAYDFCPGTLYAAYELMAQTIDYEVYGPQTITYTSKKDVKLPNFDIKDVPDFNWRVTGHGMTRIDPQTANRMRISQNQMDGPTRFQMTLGGATYHNMQKLITPEEYRDRPYWFAQNMQSNQSQHCYTCRGDEAELTAFVDETVERLKSETEAQPYAKFAILGQADAPYWCDCDACQAVAKEYGGMDSATVILWTNRVSDKYYAWLNEAHPDREVKLSIFAYYNTKEPPAVQNEKGEWEAMKSEEYPDGLRLKNGVSVLYAPIEANRIDSFYYNDATKPDNNNYYYNLIKGWSAVCDSVSLWIYGTNYRAGSWITPYNCWNCLQDNYKFAKENNVYWMMYQRRNSTDSVMQTGFQNLAAYLDSKFLWNVNDDFNTLVDAYFAATYGPAASQMRAYFDSVRAQFVVIENNTAFSRMGDTDYIKAAYWPESLLLRHISLCDEALAAIESLRQTADSAYLTYKDNIVLESIAARYLLLELYGSNYRASELAAMRAAFKSDAIRVGITRTSEQSSIQELFDRWDV